MDLKWRKDKQGRPGDPRDRGFPSKEASSKMEPTLQRSEGKAFAKKAGRETILGGEFFRSAKTKIAGWGAYARVRKKKKWN